MSKNTVKPNPQPENDLSKQTLKQIYTESAARYHAAFPYKLKNLLVISSTEQIYASPDIAEYLTKNAEEVRKLIKGRSEYMLKLGAGGLADGEFIKKESLKCISLDTSNEFSSYIPDKYHREIQSIKIFDHETGHLVVKEGWPKNSTPHIAECAADAYAALRNLQRFGNAPDIFEYEPQAAAVRSITFSSSPIHYTSAVTQKIASIQREKRIDIQSLSLTETALLAGELAVRYSLDGQTLDKLHAAFATSRKCHQDQPQNGIKKVKSVIQIMYQNKDDDDIYRAGKLSIDRPDIKEFIKNESKTDAELRASLALLEQHEKDSGFILNAADAMDARHDTMKTPTSRASFSRRRDKEIFWR